MKNIKLIIVLVVGITFFISCDSRTTQDLEGIVPNPTYNNNVKKIIDAKCVGCHSPNSSQQAYPDLDTYQNVVDAQNGNSSNKLLCSIQAGSCTSERMPKSDAPLSSGSITTIANWIDQGFKE